MTLYALVLDHYQLSGEIDSVYASKKNATKNYQRLNSLEGYCQSHVEMIDSNDYLNAIVRLNRAWINIWDLQEDK